MVSMSTLLSEPDSYIYNLRIVIEVRVFDNTGYFVFTVRKLRTMLDQSRQFPSSPSSQKTGNYSSLMQRKRAATITLPGQSSCTATATVFLPLLCHTTQAHV